MAGAGATHNGVSTRSPSAFTDKQIAYTVKDGRAVRVLLPDGTDVLGFVYGMDAYHWGLVDLQGDAHLVHKSAPRVTLTDLRLEDLQPRREQIEQLVTPYRDWVMKDVFHQTEPVR